MNLFVQMPNLGVSTIFHSNYMQTDPGPGYPGVPYFYMGEYKIRSYKNTAFGALPIPNIKNYPSNFRFNYTTILPYIELLCKIICLKVCTRMVGVHFLEIPLRTSPLHHRLGKYTFRSISFPSSL